jgi:peptide/nickel transport system substrate-binding protein
MWSAFRRLGVAAAMVLALGSDGWAQGGLLRIGLPSVPPSLDPAGALEGPVSVIARQLFDTLVQYREGASDIEPGLATQWSVSRDGLTWTFRLRDGVRFHDGTVLTAQHVVESLERVVRPNAPHAPNPNAAPRLVRGAPGVIKEIRAVDARTLQIGLLLPYAPLPAALAHPAFSIVLAGRAGTRWVGTGPFMLTEAGAGRVVLDAHAGYWAGTPRSTRLAFLETVDDARGEALLEAQGLDVLLLAGAPSHPAGALSVPSWRVGYLALETEHEPFSREKVRKAVAAALEPGTLAPAIGSAGVPLLSFLPLGVWARRDGSPVLEANPAKAKRLLAEAGFPRGTSAGLLVGDDGGRRVDPARVAEAIRASLAGVGISAPVQTESVETALELARSGQHQMALLEARVEAGDPHFLLYPLSSSEGASKGPGAVNMSFYRNRTLDDLLIRASQVSFRPERQRLYVRAQAVLADEVPWVPLYVRLHWALVRPAVRNLRLHPSGNPRFDRVWSDQAR